MDVADDLKLGAKHRTEAATANDEVQNLQSFVYAVGPQGIIQDTVAHASGRALVSGSVTRQVSAGNTIAIRPNYQYESDENRNAGGTTLATAATTFKHHEQQVTYTQQTILRPTLVNQFQMLIGHEREPTTSRTADPGIVVAGAFTGGGGQGDLVRAETHMNLNESLAWTAGHHLIQAGFQLPDWSRRGFYDRTNFGGTFYFSGLSDMTADSIKSFEGVDRVWVEEGQSITARSWKILIPTIRKDGSEIWVSYNPELETDETHRRFVLTPPPDCLAEVMNWQDNPWFPPVRFIPTLVGNTLPSTRCFKTGKRQGRNLPVWLPVSSRCQRTNFSPGSG